MLHLKGLTIGIVLAIAVSILLAASTSDSVSADGPYLNEAVKSTETFLLFEADDEVLVAFEHGDINRPIVIGAMWNGKDAPPSSDTQSIVIQDKKGSKVTFDMTTGDMSIEAEGHLEIKAGKSMKLKAPEIDIN